MYCLRCGTKNDDNNKYCKNCNNELINTHYDQSRYSYNYSNAQEKEPENHASQYRYSYEYAYNNNLATEDKYEKAYIGENYNTIKSKEFSIPTLLFGPLYFIYRKMIKYSFLWIFFLIIIYYYIPQYILISNIALNLLGAFKFKILYQRKIENDIEKIKTQNIDLTTNELIEKCYKTGGTLKNLITEKNFFIIVIIFIISVNFIIPTIYNIFNELKNVDFEKTEIKNNNIKTKNKIILDLKLKLPNEFETVYDGTYGKYYKIDTEDNYCVLRISATNNNLNKYKEDEFIRQNYDFLNPIEVKKINNTLWKKFTIEKYGNKKNIYVKNNNNYTYQFIYTIYDDKNNKCKTYEQNILKTLKFN